METKKITNTSTGKKTFIIFIIMIILIFAFFIYYSIMLMISPARKYEAIKNEFEAIPKRNTMADERIFSDSAFLSLLKGKAFLQSRIAMAETDSIYLTLNFADSTANVEISGVIVHTSKMNSVQISKILTKGDENIILSMLASPLIIADSYSTIKKEPVMIKMAPKDTSEYKPDIMPDTSIAEPVNYVLEMTNGTRIYIYQEEKGKFSDIEDQFIFDFKYRLQNTLRSLKSVMLFKIPEYHPFIRIRLPRADAKIIYRALPKNGQIAVFL